MHKQPEKDFDNFESINESLEDMKLQHRRLEDVRKNNYLSHDRSLISSNEIWTDTLKNDSDYFE